MNAEEAKKTIDQSLNQAQLIMTIGTCSVKYEGRAASKLSNGDRMLIIKKDGTFLVHQSKGMAAINYQGPGAAILTSIDDFGKLTVSAIRKKKGEISEQITVTFQEISFCHSFDLQDDKKIQLFGTEQDLSNLLMNDLHLIEPGLVPVQQESPLAKGHIDILARDRHGALVVIEIKRRQAELNAISQLKRYVEEVSKRKDCKVRGMICAPDISENAKKMLDGYGFEFYKLNYDASHEDTKIKGLEKKQQELTHYF